MWQVLFAAAVAGSTTLAAKHLFNHPSSNQPHNETPSTDLNTNFDSPVVSNDKFEQNQEEDSVFKFSSSSSSEKRSKSKSSRKKVVGVHCRKLRFGSRESCKLDKRSGDLESNGGSGKRSYTGCLKKRRLSKLRSSKDGSMFSVGLGVGMMYMMSTGKAEISRLSKAMDETTKVVQELRTELCKRKLEQAQLSVGSKPISYRETEVLAANMSSAGIKDFECSSSVLTEELEPLPDMLEIDQLEAELESELQKLPWSMSEKSGHEIAQPEFCENEVSSQAFHNPAGQGVASYQSYGVPPSELDKKLCHLLISQQENQILELGSELYSAQSKLHEKETELSALKDCVRRLSQFSLSTASDDEAEIQEQDCSGVWGDNSIMSSEPRPTVGTKRPINFAQL